MRKISLNLILFSIKGLKFSVYAIIIEAFIQPMPLILPQINSFEVAFHLFLFGALFPPLTALIDRKFDSIFSVEFPQRHLIYLVVKYI